MLLSRQYGSHTLIVLRGSALLVLSRTLNLIITLAISGTGQGTQERHVQSCCVFHVVTSS